MPVQSEATQQLSAIPFDVLIGGPLSAAVKAQTQAAKSTVEFIQTVGFNSNGEVRNVVFTYEKDGRIVKLVVPILSIVPVPYIRVDELTISFKANISAETNDGGVDTSSTSYDADTSASGRYGLGFWGVRANFNASYSSKRDSVATRDSRYSVEYTMDVYCRAVQDNIPAGLSSVLALLRESIAPKPIDGTLTIEIPNNKIVQGTDIEVTVTATKNNTEKDKAVGIYITLSCENQLITIDGSRQQTDSNGQAKFKVQCKSVPPPDDKTPWKPTDVLATVEFVAVGTNYSEIRSVQIVGATGS